MKETSAASHHPFVTVIVPVYNAGKLLSCCLDSLAQQTFKDFDVIKVDADLEANVLVGAFHKMYACYQWGLGFMQSKGKCVPVISWAVQTMSK